VLALLVGLAAVAALLMTSSASGAQNAPGSVFLSAPSYTAHENQGALTVTIERTDVSSSEQVRYGVKTTGAVKGLDFDPIGGTLVQFVPGESSYSFQVHIYDLGINSPAVHAQAYLFGSFSQALGTPSTADITILHDDPLDVRDPANPLAVATPSPYGDPLTGAPLYVPGKLGPAGIAAGHYLHSKSSWATALTVLAGAPTGSRFYFWNEPADPAEFVASRLEQDEASQPGTTVQVSTYSLVHGACAAAHPGSDSPALVKRYQRWVDGVAAGIGNFHVVMYLELDSLITAKCLSQHGQQVRFKDELAYAIKALEADPHVVVYLDAGAADANSWQETARELSESDVHAAQGFFVNSTHFDWTTTEVAYGQKISKALHGVHFVVNTGENGRGPLVPKSRVKYGNEELCNPVGRGLGPLTTSTGYLYADAFAWFSNPGGSGGKGCGRGAPPTAVFWPAYAVALVHNARYFITGLHEDLIRQGTFVDEHPR
jgi:endoglucanase